MNFKVFFSCIVISLIWILVVFFVAVENRLVLDILFVFLLSVVAGLLARRESKGTRNYFPIYKQSEVGKLSRLIIHEINSPLFVLDLLIKKTVKNPTVANIDNLNMRGHNAISSIQNVTNVLRNLGAGQPLESFDFGEKVELSQLVDEVTCFLKTNLHKNVQIDNLIPKDKILYSSYPLVLHVIINLLKNAFDYLEKGDSDTGWIKVGVLDETGGVQVYIQNSGAPLQVEVEKFFENGYLDASSGQGLIFSKIIMEAHGGTIRVDREANSPRFELFFPS